MPSSPAYRRRWRAEHKAAVRSEKLRYYRQFQKNNGRSHRPWSEAELSLVVARKRPSDRILSENLGRSVQAIQQKRAELKKRRARRAR
jgi:hypothetical protein